MYKAQRTSSSIPPPLPQKPNKSAYIQMNNDTSGTYVQPQSILPTNFRQQSPTLVNSSPNRNVNASLKLPYTKATSHSASNPYEHQKPAPFLTPLVLLFKF